MKRILVLPHLKVQNANALSSPVTIGFPAMTAWLGAVHALQRNLNNQWPNVKFSGVAVICHDINLQTHKGTGDYVNSIIGTGNPLDKTGKRPSFIEEARCHLDISLLVEYSGLPKIEEKQFHDGIAHHLNSKMKIAGGDILTFKPPEFCKVEDGDDADLRKVIRKVMPGYAVIERRELMTDAMMNGKDALDALLDYLAVHHTCEQDEKGTVTWSSQRKTAGWIVPLATGFHGLTELGKARNQRDPETPHRFAESIITLGEFRMPHRITSLDEILWRYHYKQEENMYLCQQAYCEA